MLPASTKAITIATRPTPYRTFIDARTIVQSSSDRKNADGTTKNIKILNGKMNVPNLPYLADRTSLLTNVASSNRVALRIFWRELRCWHIFALVSFTDNR